MKEPGLIAKKALEVALGFEKAGTHEEGGENRGFQVSHFLASVGLKQGNPWCAAFIRHDIEKGAGFLNLTIPKGFPDSGYCPDFKNWAVSNNLWIPVNTASVSPAVVKPSDMVLFYFPAKQRVAHTGMVVSVHAWGVNTVEGNTGPERSEINREGDGVYFKVRAWSEIGSQGGFVRLPF